MECFLYYFNIWSPRTFYWEHLKASGVMPLKHKMLGGEGGTPTWVKVLFMVLNLLPSGRLQGWLWGNLASEGFCRLFQGFRMTEGRGATRGWRNEGMRTSQAHRGGRTPRGCREREIRRPCSTVLEKFSHQESNCHGLWPKFQRIRGVRDWLVRWLRWDKCPCEHRGLLCSQSRQVITKVSFLTFSWSVMCPTLCKPMDGRPPGSSVHGISQQEYWSGLPFPTPGDLSNPGLEPVSFASPALAGGFFTTAPPRCL